MDLVTKIIDLLWEGLPFYGSIIALTHILLLLFWQKKYGVAICVAIFTIIWIAILLPLIQIVGFLGVDSFSEATSFDMSEAKFWLSTAINVNTYPSIKRMIIYAAVAVAYFGGWAVILLLNRIFNLVKWKYLVRIQWIFALALIIVPTIMAVQSSAKAFVKSSSLYTKTRGNFTPPENLSDMVSNNEQGIPVVLYIGESTTSMHMGVYGYPRATTPHLSAMAQNDENLIIFKNVFSTHTHTAPSLLEAMSFRTENQDAVLPINNQKRISVVDVLDAVGVDTNLYSNQGLTGTWNQATKIIFDQADMIFSTESNRLGNADDRIEKPFDHVFLDRFIKERIPLINNETSLNVFHSYAGHGIYKSFIPSEFHSPVDDFFNGLSDDAIAGDSYIMLDRLEGYDSTIRYIDDNINTAIKAVKNHDTPLIFIYFSDHGESPFSGRGHDSARFIHEMARIPFILYFNDAAINANPALYQKYKILSHTGNDATLHQLPKTLADVMGITFTGQGIDVPAPIGGAKSSTPIVVRDMGSHMTYTALGDIKSDIAKDITDAATQYYNAQRRYGDQGIEFCYHRSNSIGKAIRGMNVADCIEIDVVVNDDNSIHIYHEPAKDVGLSISKILEFTPINTAIWIDAKNINEPKKCMTLAHSLKMQPQRHQYFIEFPSATTNTLDDGLTSCVNQLKNIGAKISYYVPTSLAMACAGNLQSDACNRLNNRLNIAIDSGLFTDFSFDYRAINAIEHLSNTTRRLSWNAWNVTPNDLPDMNLDKYNYIIMPNNDPNNR